MLKTLDVYDGTVDFLRELDLDDDTLAKAIIGTIGDVDSYQLPDAKGYSRYGNTLPISLVLQSAYSLQCIMVYCIAGLLSL